MAIGNWNEIRDIVKNVSELLIIYPSVSPSSFPSWGSPSSLGLFSSSFSFSSSSTFASAGFPRAALAFWPSSNAVLNKAASIKIKYTETPK